MRHVRVHYSGYSFVLAVAALVLSAAFLPRSSTPALARTNIARSDSGSWGIGEIGHLGGCYYDFWVTGGTLYAVYPTGVTAFDVSNPSSPRLIGDYFNPVNAGYNACAATGTALYADANGAAHGFDVSDPTNIRRSSITTESKPMYSGYDAEIDGDLLYLPGEYDGFSVFDISAGPSTVTEVQQLDIPGSEYWWNAEAANGWLYAWCASQTGGERGVAVYDARTRPLVRKTFVPHGAYLADLALDGDRLYVGGSGPSDSLSVIDISDPGTPTVLGTVALSSTNQLAAKGDYAYSLAMNELRIVDATTPSSPSVVTTMSVPDYPAGVFVEGSRLYVLSDFGFSIYDIGVNPAAPVLLGSYTGPNYVTTMTHSGSGALFSGSSNARHLFVSDITHPTSIKALAVKDLPDARVQSLSAVGSRLAALMRDTSGSSSLSILDVASPANPMVLGTSGVGGWELEAVTLAGTNALLWGSDGLDVYNVANPASMSRKGGLTSLGAVSDVLVTGSTTYVTYDGATGYGLAAIDVSGPASPSVLSTTSIDGLARPMMSGGPMGPMASYGDRLYVNTFQKGVQVYDIADPIHPVLVGNEGDVNTYKEICRLIASADGVWSVPDNWGDLRFLTLNEDDSLSVDGKLAVDASDAVSVGGALIAAQRDGLVAYGIPVASVVVTYSAGAGGSVEGPTTQILDYGADGSAVTAVPNAGYRFVKWSDGSTANPRTDTGVVADLAVTAEFAPAAPEVTGAKFSNPIAYQLKSLLTTRFSCNVDVSGASGKLEILNGSGAVVKTIYNGAMAAGANTLPAWNGLDVSGARLFTAAWTWRLTVSKGGQSTVLTGKIPVSKIYFNMTGTATSLSSQVKYMMPGNANIYVQASTTRATDTLSISCYEPSGRRVGTLSYPMTSAKALNATSYFKLATVVRERGNHTWRISGSNVTYSILVIQ